MTRDDQINTLAIYGALVAYVAVALFLYRFANRLYWLYRGTRGHTAFVVLMIVVHGAFAQLVAAAIDASAMFRGYGHAAGYSLMMAVGMYLQSTFQCTDDGTQIDEVERLRTACQRAIKIIDTNLYHQREKVEDASSILRDALESEVRSDPL